MLDKARELGIDTKKAENALNVLNETASITENSPNETNEQAYEEALESASREVAELQFYIEQNGETVDFGEETETEFTDDDFETELQNKMRGKEIDNAIFEDESDEMIVNELKARGTNNAEIVAYFVSDNLFKKEFGDIGRLATELKGTKKQKFVSFIKNIFARLKNAFSGINKLEKKFLKLYDSAQQNKNTAKNSGVKQMRDIDSDDSETNLSNKIVVGMSDSERSKILNNKFLEVEHYNGQADSLIFENLQDLESKKIGTIKKTLKIVADSFGNYGKYDVKDFDIEVSYSSNTVKESAAKITDAKTLSKLFPIIDKAIENAIGISSENNRYYYDDKTNYYHTLLSGYVDGNYFVPIRFGIKENTQGKNKLYIVVEQNKIDLKVLKLPVLKKGYDNSRLRSTISISEIFKNVNSKDLLRYLPV